MGKRVLIISTSLRGGSNSDILAKECEKGAMEAGHEVEYISLKGKEIKYCIGCLSCQSKGACVLKDDVAEIMDKVKKAEIIVFATPIYYYEMSGQMKTLLDRLNPLYPTDYKFREIYMIATAAEDEDSTFEKALAENNIDAVSRPEIDIVKMEKGQDLVFRATKVKQDTEITITTEEAKI